MGFLVTNSNHARIDSIKRLELYMNAVASGDSNDSVEFGNNILLVYSKILSEPSVICSTSGQISSKP